MGDPSNIENHLIEEFYKGRSKVKKSFPLPFFSLFPYSIK